MSNAFEERQRIPLFSPADGTPILGMRKFIRKDPDLSRFFSGGNADLVLAPNSDSGNPISYSTCSSHGGFDDDKATVTATLNRILNTGNKVTDLVFKSSDASLKDQRQLLNMETS